MATWDAVRVQTQIRLVAYRFSQLRERHDQTSNITKRDIATLIDKGDVDTARSKVEKLIRDDRLDALFVELESYCKVLLERFPELDHITSDYATSPVMQAVCGLIAAVPHTEVKDAIALGENLQRKYGVDFTRFATNNFRSHAPSHIIDTLTRRPPSSVQVDVYMVSIAKAYQLTWAPPMLPHQKSHALSGLLDESTPPASVDLDELRRICERGIPQQPPWLRPRVWKLLLGSLSTTKGSWETEAHSKRQSYYALARRLLTSMQNFPPPTTPLTPLDASLLNMEKFLTALPGELNEELELSPLCPLDGNAPEGLRIESADAVDARLKLIRSHMVGTNDLPDPPEIRLETPFETSHSLSSIASHFTSENSYQTAGDLTMLTKSHTTSLLRLLYIHSSLHLSAPITHLTSLLIPLYVVMAQEIEPTELAHVEADTFWLFVELWGEVGELAENEEDHEWLRKFSMRLAWADHELFDDLSRKGLDPALPHYSYRWLTPLLTRTLPIQSVLTIWDALFTRASRTSDHNAKLEFLLDVCTSMLIHVRAHVFRLGKTAQKSPSLWDDVDVTLSSPSSDQVVFEEGFIQGMDLLQNYPMGGVGGPERIIDTALSLDRRRERLVQETSTTPSLGERLRGSMWNITKKKSVEYTNAEPEGNFVQAPSPKLPDLDEEDEEDEDVSEIHGNTLLGKISNTVWRGITNKSSMDVPRSPPPASPSIPLPSPAVAPYELPLQTPTHDSASIGSRLGNSIWRGITNQSAMDDPPSPVETRASSSSPDSRSNTSPVSQPLRDYAGKIRDYGAAAALSTVGTSWTAKASKLWGRSGSSDSGSLTGFREHSRAESLNLTNNDRKQIFQKRGSLPSDIQTYSPPPRPVFRESRYFPTVNEPDSSNMTRPSSSLRSPDFLNRGRSALASLAGVNQSSGPRAGPRPLLLNASSLITPQGSRPRSRSPTPVPRSSQPQRDSISSISSSSTSFVSVPQNAYSDRDSDPGNGGRLVPLRRALPVRSSPKVTSLPVTTGLNQHFVSGSELEQNGGTTVTEFAKNSERRTSSEDGPRRGWGKVELPDSPSTLPSSPPPRTPVTTTLGTDVGVDDGAQHQRNHDLFSESGNFVQTQEREKTLVRKKSWNKPIPPRDNVSEIVNDFSTISENRPGIRSRRYGRTNNLRLASDTATRRSFSSAEVSEQRNSGDMTTLMPEVLDEGVSATPRATEFSSSSSSSHHRSRKLSRSPRRPSRRADVPERESGGEEGDDEGYDEFLSAYESEELPK